jgi:hypothetical protein
VLRNLYLNGGKRTGPHPLRRRFTSALQARLQLLWTFLCPPVIENSFPTFHRGTARNPARYNAENLDFFEEISVLPRWNFEQKGTKRTSY